MSFSLLDMLLAQLGVRYFSSHKLFANMKERLSIILPSGRTQT